MFCMRIQKRSSDQIILKTERNEIMLEESARFSTQANTLLSRFQGQGLVEVTGNHRCDVTGVATGGQLLHKLLQGSANAEAGREHIPISL